MRIPHCHSKYCSIAWCLSILENHINLFRTFCLTHSWMLVLIMASKIQLFQSLREFFKIFGLHPLQLHQGSYNFRNIVALFFMTTSMVSSGAFFICKADNIWDYGASFYSFITELINIAGFPTFRNNMTKLFELMDEFEAFIEKSELERQIKYILSF